MSAPPKYGAVPAADLAGALRRAEAAHRESRRPDQDQDWPAWYAAYMTAEQTGTDPFTD
jgi:hypothetical protein